MENYKRLTKPNRYFDTDDWEHDTILEMDENRYEYPQYDYEDICEKLNRLVELEDKIENRTLIEPPCKVGDTVYYFFDVTGFYDIVELTVEDIVIRLNPSKCILHCKSKSHSWNSFCDDNFGKTLFFTKAEAEAKLKEIKSNV